MISLSVPTQLSFDNSSPIKMLTLQNTCLQKLAFKIRTNNKTALSMSITHDFLAPMSKREIPIKLMEVHVGVKLEINYAKATEEMITKNDAKMTGVDKKDIKKCIVNINVSDIIDKKVQSLDSSVKTQIADQEMNSSVHNTSFGSVKAQKEKGMNSSIYKAATNQILDVVQQHPEQDEEELEQKKKALETELTVLDGKIVEQKSIINMKRKQLQELKAQSSHEQPIKAYVLLPILAVAFFFGNLIKMVLY